jgi:hypothetical protein
VASASTNVRNVRQHVCSTSNDAAGIGIMGSSIGTLPAIMEMMNKQNRALMRRSFREVHFYYQLAKSALDNARIENDLDSISFYEIACCNLKDEMKSFRDA